MDGTDYILSLDIGKLRDDFRLLMSTYCGDGTEEQARESSVLSAEGLEETDNDEI